MIKIYKYFKSPNKQNMILILNIFKYFLYDSFYSLVYNIRTNYNFIFSLLHKIRHLPDLVFCKKTG